MQTPLSLTGKRWLEPAAESGDVLAKLLKDRNLDQLEKKVSYPQMGKAVERINKALVNAEQIAIFGDYDCDGVTSTAQLLRFFKRRGVDPIVRLPHRVKDGYGLKESIIRELIDQDVTLLITVDTGIASEAEVALAQSLNIDVIITDHHHAPAKLPAAHSIIHPITNPEFPQPYPCGAGVVYSLVCALEGKHWPDQLSDLVLASIGTIADLVPLTGLNRQLVRTGLEALQKLKSGPLAELRDITKSQTSTDIAFRIAPRLNAAGRLDDPTLALTALLEGGAALAQLDELNKSRQERMKILYNQVEACLVDPSQQALLWVAQPNLPHGLVGLIAGRLTEKYGKPSLVATINDGMCTASLRSPECYHIAKGLERHQSLLTAFGGHAQAAGCSFNNAAAEQLKEALTKDILEQTKPEDLVPTIKIDATLKGDQVTLDFCNSLSALEPFGQGNPEPKFLLENVTLDEARQVGSDGSHLQTTIAGTKTIGFGLGEFCDQAGPVDIVCRLNTDAWQGKVSPQLIIEDLRVAVPATVAL